MLRNVSNSLLGVPLLGALGLAGATAAHAADLSLGEAIKQADKKLSQRSYPGRSRLRARDRGGGGEEQGLPPIEDEISEGPVRVTLTYAKELGHEDVVLYVPIVTIAGKVED